MIEYHHQNKQDKKTRLKLFMVDTVFFIIIII